MRILGYAILALGVGLTTSSLVVVGGWVGYGLAVVNLACVVIALICLSVLRGRKR